MDALTTWGRVSCNSKMASFLVNYMSGLPSAQGKQVPVDEINILRTSIIYVVGVIERERQTLPSCCMAKPQPIRDFPTIECGTLYCLLLETPINRGVRAPRDGVLKLHSLRVLHDQLSQWHSD